MAPRSAPASTRQNSYAATTGSITPTGHAAGHGFVQPVLAEGLLKFGILDDLLHTSDDDTDQPADTGSRPDVTARTVTTTDTGSITNISFDDGSTLVVTRSHTTNSDSLTAVRTDSTGAVTTDTHSVTKLSDTQTQISDTHSDGSSRTTTIDSSAGTTVVQTVEADGDKSTLTVTQDLTLSTVTAHLVVTQADGDSGILDYSLTRSGTTETVDISGQTADGVAVDSVIIIDGTARTVKVTDHQGDIATYNIATFMHEVHDHGLVGVIADVTNGYFG